MIKIKLIGVIISWIIYSELYLPDSNYYLLNTYLAYIVLFLGPIFLLLGLMFLCRMKIRQSIYKDNSLMIIRLTKIADQVLTMALFPILGLFLLIIIQLSGIFDYRILMISFVFNIYYLARSIKLLINANLILKEFCPVE